MSKTVSAALMRKLSVGQQGTGSKSRALLRALRLTVARSSVERVQLSVSVIGAKQASKTQEGATSGLEDGQLFLLFTNNDSRVASVLLDAGLVSAIIQKQTFGEVLPDPPQQRLLTDTDAAMVVPLVEDMIGHAQMLVDDPKDATRLCGYEFASRAVDLRALSLALVEDSYDAFELTVEMEGGVRQGTILFLLPDKPVEDGDADRGGTEQEKTLVEAAGVVRAELNAVIFRMNLPLAALSDLHAGDLLPLSGARLDRVDVVAIDRNRMTQGRLGQCGGLRAVRINEQVQIAVPASPDVQTFVERRRNSTDLDAAEADCPDDTSLDTSHQLSELSATVDENALKNTDRIASEISELAGLPAPTSKSDV